MVPLNEMHLNLYSFAKVRIPWLLQVLTSTLIFCAENKQFQSIFHNVLTNCYLSHSINNLLDCDTHFKTSKSYVWNEKYKYEIFIQKDFIQKIYQQMNNILLLLFC